MKVFIGNGAFLRFCVVSSICSSLAGCALDTAGTVKATRRQWFVSVAKDSNSPGGTSEWKPIAKSKVSVHDILLGDFDGDRKADVFTTWGGKWHVSVAKNSNSLGGTSNWTVINEKSTGVSNIRLGDFDGDGKTDVFTTFFGQWPVSVAKDDKSLGGTSKWKLLNKSNVSVHDILLGDFDGDNKTDVFTTGGGKWRVSVAKDKNSFGGTSNWQVINEKSTGVSDILLGDFDGDKKTDVFITFFGQWLVSVAKDKNSFGGTSEVKLLTKSNVSVHDILLGDFNGNNRPDVFTTGGGKWRISIGGTSSWQIINTSGVEVSNILLGDFDRDRKVDVFTTL